LVGETLTPIAASDYEYERRGTADIFIFTELLGNWRCAEVTETRTRIDWAMQIKTLVDVYYPEATVIRLVMDNTRTLSARYTKHSRRKKHGGSRRTSKSTTRRSTVVG
jgi:hypothetical protein